MGYLGELFVGEVKLVGGLTTHLNISQIGKLEKFEIFPN